MCNSKFILAVGLTLSKAKWQSTETHFDIRIQKTNKQIVSSFAKPLTPKNLRPKVKFLPDSLDPSVSAVPICMNCCRHRQLGNSMAWPYGTNMFVV